MGGRLARVWQLEIGTLEEGTEDSGKACYSRALVASVMFFGL